MDAQHYIKINEAAQRFGGISAEALKRRLKRYNAQPGNKPVQMIPGFVLTADFYRWLSELPEKGRK